MSTIVVALRLALLMAAWLIITSTSTKVDTPDIKRISAGELDKVIAPYIANEKYIREIHSMMNAYAYKGEMLASQMLIETNDLINTKTGKRNVDLINSILGLPKGMNEAGR